MRIPGLFLVSGIFLFVLLCAVFFVSCSGGSGSVGGSNPPVASFTSSPNMGTASHTVTFINTSSTVGVIGYYYFWDWDDGTTSDTPGQSGFDPNDPSWPVNTFTHIYENPGTYCPTLRILWQLSFTGPQSTSSACQESITVTAPPPPAHAQAPAWIYREGPQEAPQKSVPGHLRLDDIRMDPDGPVAIVVDANGEGSEISFDFWSQLLQRRPGETWLDRDERCRLVGVETIEVPAGIFDCRVVERLKPDGCRTLTWYHPDAWRVREVRHDGGGSPFISELVEVALWPQPVMGSPSSSR